MHLKGNITKQHIDNGLRRRFGKCPVALALQEVAGADWNIRVRERRVSATNVDTRLVWEASLGYSLAHFVLLADYDMELQPMTFSLDFRRSTAE